jgi:transposase
MAKKTHTIKPRKARKAKPVHAAVRQRDFYAGIDFAENWHDFAVVDRHGNCVDGYQVANTRDGIDDLIETLKKYGTASLPVPVAIEGNADSIVHELHRAEFPVILIPPYSVKEARGAFDSNLGKTDEIDAELLANMVRLNQQRWMPRQPDSENTQAMRLAARTQREESYRSLKLGQQMRSLMRMSHVVMLEEIGKDLVDYKTVNLLRAVPTPTLARSLSVDDWDRVLRAAGPYQKRRAKAQRLYEASQAPALLVPPALEAAHGDRLLLLVDHLDTSLRALKKADEAVLEHWAKYPFGHLFEGALNFTPRIGARIFSEIGDDPSSFTKPRKLLAYSGFAPVPHSSGKRIGFKIRKAYNRFLHQAVRDWVAGGFNPQAENEGMQAHFFYRRNVLGDTGPQAYRNTGARYVKAI